MRRLVKYALLLTAFFPNTVAGQALSFSGNSLKVIEVKPEKSSGLDMIYVLYSAKGVSVSYTADSGNQISWSRYDNLGGSHAEEIYSEQQGNVSTIANIQGNKGYIVSDGDRNHCFWITEYEPYRLSSIG